MSKIEKLARLTTERNLALEVVRLTEAAAIASFPYIGKGDKYKADKAATEAMRNSFSKIYISGTVVIGEGELDKAPMLYNGEKVGRWGDDDPKVDIAVDPLEGTKLCSKNRPNAITCMALTDGKFLQAPDMYMNKIVVGKEASGVIDIEAPVKDNLIKIAKAYGKDLKELNIILLERIRNEYIVEAARELDCKVTFISDGDISASLYAILEDSPMDVYMGIGGAPEGVITSAAVKSVEGDMQAKLAFDFSEGNKAEINLEELKRRASEMGIKDFEKIYSLEDLVKGNTFFAASGVTDGELLRGVRETESGYKLESLVMRSRTGTIRWLSSEYNSNKKIDYLNILEN